MPRPWIVRHCLSVLLLTGAFDTTPLAAQECRPQRTGLVLSGGGAKGFAHIGVFKILDSLQIHPDFIVGSSIGAIAGALYASGYSGQEIDSISRVLPIADVIRAYSPIAPGVIGALPAFAVWENNGRGFALQTGSVREHEVNALMSALMLRGNLLARGDFDRLPIPLRVVGTRLSTRKPVVLSKGDLAQAVRASFAIPLIFAPGVINGEMLMDGGVSDNIPVAAARAMGADRLIVSTLPTATVSDELLGDPMKVALQLTDLLFRNDSSGYRPQDLIIRNKTTDFNPLDFSPGVMDTLVLGGMQVARDVFAAAGCIRTMRDAAVGGRTVERRVPSVLAGVTVGGDRKFENQTLRFAMGLRTDRPLVEDSLRSRLLQLGQSDDYRAIWLNPSGSDSAVSLAISPVYGAKQAIVVGLAYDNDLGGRLWGGIAWRDLFKASLEASTSLDVSKYRQEFQAGLRRRIPAFQRAAPLIARFSAVSEDIRIFGDSAELNPVSTRELSVAAGISAHVPLGFTLNITPNFRWWGSGDVTQVGAVGLSLRLTDGERITETHTIIEGELNSRFQRVHLETKHDWRLPFVDVVPRARVSWSRRAPLQQLYFLGGYDGFGGLRTTERRGEQEAMAGLAISRPVFGPIRGIGEIMTGAMGSGPGFLRRVSGSPFGQVITGGRVGAEIQTTVLNVLVQRGFNSAGGDIWFVRLGQWF